MKIIFFIDSYLIGRGGGAEVIRNLARTFKEMGHSVLIIAHKSGLDLPCKEILEGTEVLRYEFPLWSRHPKDVIRFLMSLPLNVLRLQKQINKFKPDVINVHVICRYSVYPLFLSCLVKFPFIASIHGSDVIKYPYDSPLDHKISLAWFKRARYITSNSRWLLVKAKKLFANIDKKSFIVGNGVHLKEFDNPKMFQHPKPFIFSIGRFIPRKGFEIIIKAFKLVSDQIDNIDLIIAGYGQEKTRYVELIDQLGMQKRIHLLSHADRRQTVSLFHSCEFFVLPSLWEPFGIVNLEAMAAKKSIIATKVGGVQEIIKDGYNGMFVRPDDIKDLVEKIVYLLGNPDLYRTMGERGRKMVEEQYTWKDIAEKYIKVYQKTRNSNVLNS